MKLVDSLRIDKGAFSVTSLSEQDEQEKQYWLAKTPYERMQAIEVMRQIIYGYDQSTTRLVRVLAITERASS